MIKPWVKTGSKALGDYRIFSIRADTKVSPRTGEQHDFFVLESVNWVNVIAVTADDHLVMVEQYRHGSNTVELEIPGGMMDHGEDPIATGLRELREETGYEGQKGCIIGDIFPNPAIMSNRCYTVMVTDCCLLHPVAFDSGEDLITRLVPVRDIDRLVRDGNIRHSLVLVALYHYDLLRRSNQNA
jgi:ADP-ribose pyrophosphatase